MAQDLPPSGGYEPIQYKVSLSIRPSVLPTRLCTSSLPISNAPKPSPLQSNTIAKQQQQQQASKERKKRARKRPHTYIHEQEGN